MDKKTLKAIAKILPATAVVLGALASVPFASAYHKISGNRARGVRNFFMNRAADLMSIKIEFTENSAPLRESNTVFGIKHLARADAFVVPHFPNGDFMMTAHFFNAPKLKDVWDDLKKFKILGSLNKLKDFVVGNTLRVGAESVGFIPTQQSKEKKEEDLGHVIQRLNKDSNVPLFNEGTCPGHLVLEFSKGSLEPAYGINGVDRDGNTVSLENKEDFAFQPVALRVKSIDGEDVLEKPEKWDKYNMILDKRSILMRVFDRMKADEIVLELHAFPPLMARDFDNAADLANEGQRLVTEIVNPGQTFHLRRKEFLEWREEQPHRTYW